MGWHAAARRSASSTTTASVAPIPRISLVSLKRSSPMQNTPGVAASFRTAWAASVKRSRNNALLGNWVLPSWVAAYSARAWLAIKLLAALRS